MDIAIVYMVAGMSSRFGGKIKQFAKIGPDGETLIEYSIKQTVKAGFTKIIFIVGSKTEEPFKKMFGNSYKKIPIEYVLQTYDSKERDRPWGTLDAICTIKDIIDCPFVICNGDDIYGEKTFKILYEHLKNNKEEATIAYKLENVLPEQGEVNRGIFETQDDVVKNIREVFGITKENLSEKGLSSDSLCSMNIFGFNPEVVLKLNKILVEFKKKHKGDRKIEGLLPKEVSKLIKNKEIKMNLYPTSEKWLGVTNPEDEQKIREIIKNKKLNYRFFFFFAGFFLAAFFFFFFPPRAILASQTCPFPST
jgi:NDP-sugar pyrophosphorylase family protein